MSNEAIAEILGLCKDQIEQTIEFLTTNRSRFVRTKDGVKLKWVEKPPRILISPSFFAHKKGCALKGKVLEKPKRVQFVCPPKLLAHLNQQATEFCAGNRSEYLRHLVIEDMRLPPDSQKMHLKRVMRERETETTIQVLGYGIEHANVLNELKTNPLFQKCKMEAKEKIVE